MPTSILEELITEQLAAQNAMSRTFANLKKKGAPTLGTIEARQQNLLAKWQSIQTRHKEILSLKTNENRSVNYFTENFIESAEETYLDEYAKFVDATHAILNKTSKPVPTATSSDTPDIVRKFTRKLPPVQLPTFSGKYADWKSYKDLFQAMLADFADLSDVERLYYLKSTLRDDAAKTIKNIPVTEENYKRAWDRLVEHYDNTRALVHSAVSALFQIPTLTKETASGLRQLRDAYNEAIETLEALDRPVKHWDDILVFIITQRLDSRTSRDWQTTRGDTMEPLTFSQLDTFLKSRIEVLEFVELPKLTANSDQAPQRKNSGNAASFKSQPAAFRISAHTASPQPVKSQVTCVYCKASHYIAACDGFRTLAADERKSYVKDNNLCFNCLGRHLLRDCRSTKTCRQCQGRHHTLLHIATTSPLSATLAQPESADPQPPAEKRTGVSAHTIYGSPHHSILLATARVIVISELQRSIEARALVDPCSEATFISESLAQRLRLQRQSMLVPVSGIGGARCSTAKSQASIIISPYFKTSTQWKLKALILPHLSDYIPPNYTLVKNLSFVADLQLADKDINSNDKVDLIIGADLYPALIEEGLRKCDNAELIAQSTALGWILTGATPSQCSHTVVPQAITSHQISIDQDLHDLMERFRTQEEIVVKSKALTTEEEECEAHFASTHRRDPQGRYILRLPFKSSVDKLGDSASIARNTLIRMEKRFSHQPQLHKLYSDFMQEYIALDHMSETDAKKLDSSEQLFFLPHHGVLKVTADKSKLRVVFNGSIKTNSGVTLNDCLHIGPKLQNEIFDILLRWRTYRYVFSADIEKMFRQILIDECDRRYQQIFWRKNPKEDIKAYSLHTVTYGLASSPYQAIRVLHQLAADEKEKYPTAAQILLQNSYVDDILAGADSLEEAQNLRQELSCLLLAGGLPLSKWTSNHPSVLSSLSPAQVASSQQYSWPTEESYCMLGITWQPNEDCFKFSVCILGLVFSVIMMLLVWQRFTQTPTVTTIETTTHPIFGVNFPAVSICNYNKVYKPHADRFSQNMKRKGLNDTEINHFLSALPKLIRPDYINEDNRRALELMTSTEVTIEDIMYDLMQPCENLLLRCAWDGKIFDCSKIFKPIKSIEGFCCAFNYHVDIAENSIFGVKNVKKRIYNVSAAVRHNLTKHEPGVYEVLSVPGAGRDVGLSVVLDLEENAYLGSTRPSVGASILVHDPFNYPEVEVLTSFIQPTQEIAVILSGTVMESAPNVRQLDLTRRNCWFNDEVHASIILEQFYWNFRVLIYRPLELINHSLRIKDMLEGPTQKRQRHLRERLKLRKLKISPVYSYQSCITECRIRYIKRFCNCVPFYYPNYYQERVCSLLDINCLTANRGSLSNLRTIIDLVAENNTQDSSNCECLPSCDDNIYTSNSENAFMNNITFHSQILEGFNVHNVSLASIYFRGITCLKYRKESWKSWDDVLASFGGIFGLCVGGSFVSLVEFFYYFGNKIFRSFKQEEHSSVFASLPARKKFKIVSIDRLNDWSNKKLDNEPTQKRHVFVKQGYTHVQEIQTTSMKSHLQEDFIKYFLKKK